MKALFVDTSAWDALADGADPKHDLALLFRDEIAGKYHLITTNYVLDELFTLLLMNVGYHEAVAFKQRLDILVETGVMKVIWITPELADEAWEIFQRYNVDKSWSFTDCTSFAVMKRFHIEEAFAFDHHFEQMGFIRSP